MRSHWPDVVKWTLILFCVLAVLYALAQFQWALGWGVGPDREMIEVLQEQADSMESEADSAAEAAVEHLAKADSVAEEQPDLRAQLAAARRAAREHEAEVERLKADSIVRYPEDQVRKLASIVAEQDSVISALKETDRASNAIIASLNAEVSFLRMHASAAQKETASLRGELTLYRQIVTEYESSQPKWWNSREAGFAAGFVTAGVAAYALFGR